MSAANRPVVVGIDGSEHADQAAVWAANEARSRSAPLLLIAVQHELMDPDRTSAALHRVALRCRDQGLDVIDEVIEGHPVDELLRAGQRAQLLVLGDHGLGGFHGAALGSVSNGVSALAACPIVIVKNIPPDPEGPVVVGLDESPHSQSALRFAFDVATRRNVDLLAIQAWHEESLLAVPLPPPEREQVERRIAASLAEQIASWSVEYPRVSTRPWVRQGHPVAVLVDAARDAQLLVVGNRGRGGFSGLFLGSVAAGVLFHARCPLAVVPTAHPYEDDD